VTDRPNSSRYFAEALELMPGGVSSPVRAFRGVGGDPLFFERGEGAWLVDVDGGRYVDYVLSWGPLILGHAHPRVVEALQGAIVRGTSFGAPSPLELELARRVQQFFPSMELMRFVSSGTEAAMSVVRLSRAFTRRPKVVKFEGCYHGHADSMLVKAGSGVATLGLPDSPGVNPSSAADTLIAPFNDVDAVERLMELHRGEVAAVLVEPVPGNMGLVLPEPDFLTSLERLTRDAGALLIFDEVMSGFRVHPGGAQGLYGIAPDLTMLGKVVGGGLPVGVYGGRREIMKMVAPSGPVYQAGTLSGNPAAMAAGIATLDELARPGVWDGAAARAASLAEAAESIAGRAGVSVRVHVLGTMACLFFSDGPVRDWASASRSDTSRFARFFHAMLDGGVYWPPSQFEAVFLSTAHGDREFDLTVRALEQALLQSA
jgi:glutamate-1-semialdehyde 2,1-aminomutase